MQVWGREDVVIFHSKWANWSYRENNGSTVKYSTEQSKILCPNKKSILWLASLNSESRTHYAVFGQKVECCAYRISQKVRRTNMATTELVNMFRHTIKLSTKVINCTLWFLLQKTHDPELYMVYWNKITMPFWNPEQTYKHTTIQPPQCYGSLDILTAARLQVEESRISRYF